MIPITGVITGQSLNLTQEVIVSDTNDYLTAEFKFSPEWDGLSKWAHFTNGDKKYQVMLDGEGKISRDKHLNLGEGIWEVFLHGTSSDGMRITSDAVDILVKRTGSMEGGPLPEIPLTPAEQIDAKAQQAVETANKALQTVTDNLPLTDRAEAAAEAAEAAQESAQGSMESAGLSAKQAGRDAGQAAESAKAAEIAARGAAESGQQASISASTATDKAAAAAKSAAQAQVGQEAAARSAQQAAGSESRAKADADWATAAAEDAEIYASTAQTAMSKAETAADNAAASETAAGESAQTAKTEAGKATSSATSAAESAQTAQAQADRAEEEAGKATSKATEAAASASTAKQEADRAKAEADRATGIIDDTVTSADKAWSSQKTHAEDLKYAIKPAASGEVIAVNDSAEAPILGLPIMGKTTQNGVPTPDAPIPLVNTGANGQIVESVYGKNLAGDGIADGFRLNMLWRKDTPILLQAGVTYTFHVKHTVTALYFVDMDNKTIKRETTATCITYTSDKAQLGYLQIYEKDGLRPNLDYCGQLEIGSAPTAYEPPKAPQLLTIPTPNGLPGIPVESGGNYTDSNGRQWWCDEIDLERGVYVKKVLVVKTDSLPFHSFKTYGSKGFSQTVFVLPENVAEFPQGEHGGLCSHFKNKNEYLEDDTYFYSGKSLVRFMSDKFKSETEAISFFNSNPVTCLLTLENPTIAPLSSELIAAYRKIHTNYPVTTVFNDGGAGQAMTYVADPKNYIDNKFTALNNAVLSMGGNI